MSRPDVWIRIDFEFCDDPAFLPIRGPLSRETALDTAPWQHQADLASSGFAAEGFRLKASGPGFRVWEVLFDGNRETLTYHLATKAEAEEA